MRNREQISILSTHILFFSPAANIWEHSFPEALVAEMLVAKGLRSTMVRCKGMLLPLCPAAQGAGINADTPESAKKALCANCNAKAQLIDGKMGLRHIAIDDFIEPGDARLIDALLEQADALRSALRKASDFEQLCINGIPVGRTALYDLILRHKKNDFDFSDAAWDEYLIFLRLAAQVTLLSERMLKAEQPDRVSVYNSLYVPHRAFCLEARRAGIAQYFMHAGTNLARQHGTLMIGRDFTWKYLRDLADRYDHYKDIPLSTEAVADATDHFLCLLSASNIFVYSAARSQDYFDVRAHFGIKPEQKLIIASTSSYDERFAVESVKAATPSQALLFPRILDWVAHLVELAKQRPDWFLLIRVHPREFPNRRDHVKSEHAERMRELLNDLPDNVKVNWPDDNLSVYDLAQEADLFLNAWSSVGKEMALLGLPVVIYSPEIVLYPSALNRVATTKDDYIAAIEAALAEGWSFDLSQKAHRWFALEFCRSRIDLLASYAPRNRYNQNIIQRVVMRIARKLVSFPQERWDLMWRKPMPETQAIVSRLFYEGLENSEQAKPEQQAFNGSTDEELAAIRNSLLRIGTNLFSANPTDRPSKLQKAFAAAGIVTQKRIK
jgi:hypothetical protein